MRPLKIAVLTFEKAAQLCNDRLYLEPLFKQENMIYEEVMWDTPKINWNLYDAVLVRSTCDYFENKYDHFLKTLKGIEESGVPLFNPFDVIQWNSKKHYLMELQLKGFSIVDTLFTTPRQILNLSDIMQEKGWKECVVKPAISAGAHKTFRLTIEGAKTFVAHHYFKIDEDILVQPFMQEICDEGEWSFIFFNKQFSHAMLSRPKVGDFRVQFFHGGILKRAVPEPWMINAAHQVLLATGFEKLPYARIDAIKKDDNLLLMEVELIEPYLYFDYYPETAQTFVTAIKNYINL